MNTIQIIHRRDLSDPARDVRTTAKGVFVDFSTGWFSIKGEDHTYLVDPCGKDIVISYSLPDDDNIDIKEFIQQVGMREV